MADPENPFEPSSKPSSEPEAPRPTSQQQERPLPASPFEERKKRMSLSISLPADFEMPSPKIIGAAIAAIAIVGLLIVFGPNLLKQVNTPTTTTTIVQVNLSKISACGTINKPGNYYLSGNINTSITSGACILITASNVRFVGNQHSITGNGPYTGIPPFSYGIAIQGGSNDSVTGVQLSKFSYGIFLNGTTGALISLNNISSATLSGIYLFNANNNTLKFNRVGGTLSVQGGVFLSGTGSNNKLFNNTLINNAYYGLVVNTTGNNFTQNIFAQNPVDLVCNSNSAPKNSNIFSGSRCVINDYCGFATCGINVPYNLSSIKLQPGNVYTCGAIFAPGNYSLQSSISTSSYVSSANPLSRGVACIRIFAPNVNFNCNGKQITNSGYGILLNGAANANITNCVLAGNSYGVAASKAFSPQVSNTITRNNTYGLFFTNTTGGKVSNSNFSSNNIFGIYLNSTSGVIFSKVVSRGNTYGVYIDGGSSDVLSGGSAYNNSNTDLACTSSTYNSTSNLAQNFNCGLNSCLWAAAACKQTVQVKLPYYPLSSCKTITTPGNYTLLQNIISNGNCFNINTNNVNFNCQGRLITGSATGSAFYVNNAYNVSISHCNAVQFVTGINVSNSRQVVVNSIVVNASTQGLQFYNVSFSSVKNVNVIGATSNGFIFSSLSNSIVANNTATRSTLSASGFSFTNAIHDILLYNNATLNPLYGYQFLNSLNNTVRNNNAGSNLQSDYACFGTAGSVYSNPVGVNFGLTKSGCRWLVEVSSLVPSQTCSAFFAPTQVVLTRDLLYTPGGTCFSAYNRNSTSSSSGSSVNCNGHIVFATNSGIFANIHNSSSFSLSNCVIWNFTTGIQSTGPNLNVYNNTFEHEGNAIVLNYGRFQNIYKNTINNSTRGIVVSNTSQTSVYNNNFYNAGVAISFLNTSLDTISNNTAVKSLIGMLFSSAFTSTLQYNRLLNSTLNGIACTGSAGNSTSKNLDNGGNICSSNSGCKWMRISTQCAPS